MEQERIDGYLKMIRAGNLHFDDPVETAEYCSMRFAIYDLIAERKELIQQLERYQTCQGCGCGLWEEHHLSCPILRDQEKRDARQAADKIELREASKNP